MFSLLLKHPSQTERVPTPFTALLKELELAGLDTRLTGLTGFDHRIAQQTTRPGFITPCGSSASLIARIICNATGDWWFTNASRLS
jgi:hypothetical protein